ncbi:uncharacterized protein [Miscanthus floridulus]|uniref:uncharacterized protein isoform X6 n=1 Tax=Miscanthus floridulus TaxID=154761 RepID=UPI00345AA03A
MQMASNGLVVILFAGMTAKLFEGNLSLQGSFVCRFYVNSMLPEVLALQNSKVTSRGWVQMHWLHMYRHKWESKVSACYSGE